MIVLVKREYRQTQMAIISYYQLLCITSCWCCVTAISVTREHFKALAFTVFFIPVTVSFAISLQLAEIYVSVFDSGMRIFLGRGLWSELWECWGGRRSELCDRFASDREQHTTQSLHEKKVHTKQQNILHGDLQGWHTDPWQFWGSHAGDWTADPRNKCSPC